ncbi:elongation factor P [Candidatus Auribacterota bacterium]
MVSVTNLKNGMAVKIDGSLFNVVYFQHVKPGKGGAFVRTKLKNIKTGSILEKTFRGGESIEDIFLESKPMEYLYKELEQLVFMDLQSYDQIYIPITLCEEVIDLLKENLEIKVMFYEGTPIRVELPLKVELKVVDTPPNFKGNTASGGTKPAKLETGATIQVPFFIENEDLLSINTEKKEYIQRV